MRLKNYLLLERNILNLDEINKFIKDLSNRTNNLAIKKWLNSNLRNYLINNYDKATKVISYTTNSPQWLKKALSSGEEVFVVILDQTFKDDIEHIIDFFIHVPRNNYNYSVQDAINASKEWTKSLLKKKIKEESLNDILIVYKFPDNWKWVSLKTQNALSIEGNLMNHCVGGSYQQVLNKEIAIYSLRDPQNKPHVTIEYLIKSNKINQIKGNSNKRPDEKYWSYIIEFLNEKISPDEVLERMPDEYILTNDKKIYNIKNLPKYSKISSNNKDGRFILCLNEYEINISEGVTFYTQIKFKDVLNLNIQEKTTFKYLEILNSKNVKISNKLSIKDRSVFFNIDSLTIGDDCSLEKLENSYDCFRYTFFNHCGTIKIGKNLKGKNLEITDLLSYGELSIDDGMFITEDLNIHNTYIKKLGNNCRINKNLNITSCKCDILPSNLIVGNLTIKDSEIKSLGKNTKIAGNLKLRNIKNLTKLPEDLQVDGKIIIYDIPKTKIPKHLQSKITTDYWV